MDATLEEIEFRLTPRELFRDGISSLSRIELGKYAVLLASLLRRYPMPSALAGVSVAGLVVLAVRLRANRQRVNRRLSDAAGSTARLTRAIGAAKEKLLDSRQSLAQRAGVARARLAGATSSGMERASDLAGSAGRQLRRAGGSVQTMARAQPVAAGAIALAIGATLAFCIPSVRRRLY
jgi:hypothetical protein